MYFVSSAGSALARHQGARCRNANRRLWPLALVAIGSLCGVEFGPKWTRRPKTKTQPVRRRTSKRSSIICYACSSGVWPAARGTAPYSLLTRER